MNVLVVDDEEVLQDVLTTLIRREGHTPVQARTVTPRVTSTSASRWPASPRMRAPSASESSVRV